MGKQVFTDIFEYFISITDLSCHIGTILSGMSRSSNINRRVAWNPVKHVRFLLKTRYPLFAKHASASGADSRQAPSNNSSAELAP